MTGVTDLARNLRERAGAAQTPKHALIVDNLLLDFSGIVELFRGQVEACGSPAQGAESEDRTLDAFLLGAGANQLLEDYLHRDVWGLAKTADFVRARGRPAAARLPQAVLRGWVNLRSASPVERRWRARQRALADVLDRLAGALAASGREWRPAEGDLAMIGELCSARAPRSLRRDVLRLPNCFVSFDQRPEDCFRLAARLAARVGDRRRPIVVVGLRTSGSYLAPLTAAYLRELGFARVESTTVRPGQSWWPDERARLLDAVGGDGVVALVDDPPLTGGHLLQAAAGLEAAGIRKTSIILLLQTQNDELPAALDEYDAVLLRGEEWSIHDQLDPASIGRALGDLGWDGAIEVDAVTRWAGRRGGTGRRGHEAGLFRVRGEDGSERLVFARGMGLGYFGRHGLAGIDANRDALPAVYGLSRGVLLREWLPEEDRIDPELPFPEEQVARLIAAYVDSRSRALPVREDVSTRLVGREALWQHIAAMLGRAFGKLRLPLRPVLHRAAWRLVRPLDPSVPDGDARLRSWFVTGGPSSAVQKVDFEDGGFRAAGGPLYNFDPIFDLASAAVDADAAGRSAFSERLLTHFEMIAGPVSRERWLLYRLLLLLEDQRHAAESGASRLLQIEEALARVHREYAAAVFFSDLGQPGTGSLCAVDVDGVLETFWLTYPSLGPAGAQALRILTGHGFRPVLVTGRSSADVRARCLAYRLAGGVAEYGAALYDARSDETISLLDESAQADLDALRAALRAMPDVFVDPGYRHGVRAFRVDALRSIDERVAEQAIVQAGVAGRVRIVQGIRQTDFVAAGVDKATGLRALAGHFSDAPVAFAVGDSASDLPMLHLAERAAAPANADAEVRGAAARGDIEIQREPYQGGLLTAVTSFVGHRPSRCTRCRPPRLEDDTRLLMTVLAAQDAGKRRKLGCALQLALRMARGS